MVERLKEDLHTIFKDRCDRTELAVQFLGVTPNDRLPLHIETMSLEYRKRKANTFSLYKIPICPIWELCIPIKQLA